MSERMTGSARRARRDAGRDEQVAKVIGAIGGTNAARSLGAPPRASMRLHRRRALGDGGVVDDAQGRRVTEAHSATCAGLRNWTQCSPCAKRQLGKARPAADLAQCAPGRREHAQISGSSTNESQSVPARTGIAAMSGALCAAALPCGVPEPAARLPCAAR
jgi:hypothetical protein